MCSGFLQAEIAPSSARSARGALPAHTGFQEDRHRGDGAKWADLGPAPLGSLRDLRIWRLPASWADELLNARGTLTAADHVEAERLRHERVRRHWLAARALLRFALSEQVGHAVASRDWRFTRNRWGGPAVAPGQPRVHFSLTHCAAGTLIAVSRHGALGIDAELVAQDVEDALPAVASPTERVRLARLSGSARRAAALQLWTLKEAYIKMLGRGFSMDPTGLEFALDPPRLLRPSGAWPTVLASWRTSLEGRECQVALAMGHAPDWQRDIRP